MVVKTPLDSRFRRGQYADRRQSSRIVNDRRQSYRATILDERERRRPFRRPKKIISIIFTGEKNCYFLRSKRTFLRSWARRTPPQEAHISSQHGFAGI